VNPPYCQRHAKGQLSSSYYQGVFILLTTSGNGSFFNGQGHDGRNGHHGQKWTRLYGQNGHVQQVTSLNLSIRPSIGKSIVSIPSMMSILVHVHENEWKRPVLIIHHKSLLCKLSPFFGWSSWPSWPSWPIFTHQLASL